MKKVINSIRAKSIGIAVKTRQILADRRGEGALDIAIFCVEAVHDTN
jgi:hypothetical protein